jgi:hypothetical protein
MRTLNPALVGPLLVFLFYAFMPGCAHVALSDEMNLRAQFVEFTKREDTKRWMIEDVLISQEKQFQDSLRQYSRDFELKAQDQILQAPDWKTSKRDYREKTRNLNSELRQRIRVHREEFELHWLQIQRDQEKDLKEFLDPIAAVFKKNRNNQAYEKAEPDFESARDDVREDYSKWKEKTRDLKTPDTFLQNY